jgi:antitoxin PrlF
LLKSGGSCLLAIEVRQDVTEWWLVVMVRTWEEADAMARTTLRAKGQLTLPEDIRRAAKLEEGDLLEAVVSDTGEVVLRPLATVDRSQAWFWTEDWQAGEREASEQARRGEGQTFESGADFLDSLG